VQVELEGSLAGLRLETTRLRNENDALRQALDQTSRSRRDSRSSHPASPASASGPGSPPSSPPPRSRQLATLPGSPRVSALVSGWLAVLRPRDAAAAAAAAATSGGGDGGKWRRRFVTADATHLRVWRGEPPDGMLAAGTLQWAALELSESVVTLLSEGGDDEDLRAAAASGHPHSFRVDTLSWEHSGRHHRSPQAFLFSCGDAAALDAWTRVLRGARRARSRVAPPDEHKALESKGPEPSSPQSPSPPQARLLLSSEPRFPLPGEARPATVGPSTHAAAATAWAEAASQSASRARLSLSSAADPHAALESGLPSDDDVAAFRATPVLRQGFLDVRKPSPAASSAGARILDAISSALTGAGLSEASWHRLFLIASENCLALQRAEDDAMPRLVLSLSPSVAKLSISSDGRVATLKCSLWMREREVSRAKRVVELRGESEAETRAWFATLQGAHAKLKATEAAARAVRVRTHEEMA
jgi:hypothetical protein